MGKGGKRVTADPSLKVTMQDVATHAGVSRATVSRVLSGSVSVEPETEQVVLESIKTLGYVRNSLASRLAAGRGNTVGLLLRDPRNPAYGELYFQMERACSLHGLQLLSTSPSIVHGMRFEQSGLDLLLGNRLSGLFVSTGSIPEGELLPYVNQVPMVVLPRPVQSPLLTAVSYDEEQSARALADHVVSLGHRRIIVSLTPKVVSYVENLRGEYMLDTLRNKHGLRPIVIEASPRFGAEGDTDDVMLQTIVAEDASVVMLPNDVRAMALASFLSGVGLRIPADVSVTGLDGLGVPVSALGLTTMRMPVKEVTAKAVELMLGMIGGKITEPVHKVYPSSLLFGRTLADLR